MPSRLSGRLLAINLKVFPGPAVMFPISLHYIIPVPDTDGAIYIFISGFLGYIAAIRYITGPIVLK